MALLIREAKNITVITISATNRPVDCGLDDMASEIDAADISAREW